MIYRTYDDWKLASPDDERECDCCGKRRELTRCWTSCGIETYACAKCRGEDEEAYDD